MRKLFLFIAALTLCVGLWAETVSYLCPVYNDPDDVTKGIQKWETKTADATEITNASWNVTLGTAGNTTWYVVKGTNEQTRTLVCSGAVNIILADGAKLTAKGFDDGNAGIQVSGTGNSLTIYAQSTDPVTMGQLKAIGGEYAAGIGGGNGQDGSNITISGGTVEATGDYFSAGIGGGDRGSGSNITINGGVVTATSKGYGAGIGGGQMANGSNITINGGTVTANGGDFAAGIGGGSEGDGSNITINGGTVEATGGQYAAGIGGGDRGKGTNITINGGEVIATGGENAAGIGGGYTGDGSNIHISVKWIINADNNNPPTTPINNDGGDLASSLARKQYVTAKYDLAGGKAAAIAEIDAAIEGIASGDILAIANKAKEDINAATTEEEVNSIKNKALAELTIPIKIYNSGKAAGLAEAAAALPTDPEGTAGHTVTITKGEKTLILVNPDKVTYGKQE